MAAQNSRTSYSKVRCLYQFELIVVCTLYIGALFVRPLLLDHLVSGSALAQASMLLPILPVWGILAVVWRFYRRVDEYQRMELLRSVSIAAGITACLCCSYPFAADAFGLKPASLFYAWPVLAVVWALTTGFSQMRNKALCE